MLGEASGLIEPDLYSGARKLWVAVVGDSLLWVAEASLACQTRCLRRFCCLTRAVIWDVLKRLTRLIQPSDYYTLLGHPHGH